MNQGFECTRMRTSRLPHFVFLFSAGVHLLLFSLCPVNSSRVYETNDAIVIEVDLEDQPSTRSTRSSNYGNPAPIPMTYYNGLYHQQQQANFSFWPYPLHKPVSSSSVPNVEDVSATSPEWKQQNIPTRPCGVGPPTPPARNTPTVGVIGGTDAKPNSWPFVVGLRRFGFNSGAAFCGGSLISTTRILTAAHCVNKLTEFDISTMTVSLGMHTQGNLPDTVNDARQTRRVTRVIYHKDFNIKTWQNDIAVLTIDPPVTYSKEISAVCLPLPFNTAADQFVGKDAAIMGWGLLKSGGTQPNVLQQATVQVIGQAKCNEFWSQSPSPVFDQHICASATGKDTCQGDSGGPMVAQIKDGSTTWTQIGVASFGNSCPADSKQPSVYVSVAFFRNWIIPYMLI